MPEHCILAGQLLDMPDCLPAAIVAALPGKKFESADMEFKLHGNAEVDVDEQDGEQYKYQHDEYYFSMPEYNLIHLGQQVARCPPYPSLSLPFILWDPWCSTFGAN